MRYEVKWIYPEGTPASPPPAVAADAAGLAAEFDDLADMFESISVEDANAQAEAMDDLLPLGASITITRTE